MKDENMIDTLTDDNNTKPVLKIIKLGSDVGATKNMTVYECGDDIIVVDCGIGFPDDELLGVDVVIPDVTYLIERKDRVRGIFISHAHEDHIGAIPYVIDQLNVPIFSNKLVLGFVSERLKDKAKHKSGNIEGVSLNLFDADTPEIQVGTNFKINAFRVNHSVPGGMGFAITTPQGTVLHIADYKIDWTPVLDKPIDLGKIAEYGEHGVLCLLSDCLGVTHDGYAKSEKSLDNTFGLLFERAEGRQIVVTTISSNISRMYQIVNAAIKNGRKVVFSGRSIEQSSRIARELGYLPFEDNVFVMEKKAADYKQSDLVYIVAGCYGQTGSGLDRLARGEHNQIKLEDNSMVIFSADPNPPGVQEAVERLLHNLTLAGAEIIYSEIQDNLHVSGHGLKGDIMTVCSLSKAKYFIPIGGTAAKMRAFTNMVSTLGVPRENVFELLEGEVVEFRDHNAKTGDRVQVTPKYISGRQGGELNPIVVRDRAQLSEEGVFVVVIPVNKGGQYNFDKTEIVSRGFVYVKDSGALLKKTKKLVRDKLSKYKKDGKDWAGTKRKLENDINRMLYKELGREPLTIVHTIDV